MNRHKAEAESFLQEVHAARKEVEKFNELLKTYLELCKRITVGR